MKWLFKPVMRVFTFFLAFCLLAVLLEGVCIFRPRALCTARQGVAEHLIDNMEQAVKNYELDYGVYPPGNGNGSAELVRYLKSKGPKGLPYFEFTPEMLDAQGNILNPIHPGEDGPQGIIHYRNNKQPTRRRRPFDIMWCAGYDRPDESPNWE